MKQETVEEVAETFWLNDNTMSDYVRQAYVTGFLTGAKWQQKRMYSEEDMRTAWNSSEQNMRFTFSSSLWKNITFEQWLEQFKKK